MASEVKRLITRALDSLAVDGLLHAAGQDEPLPVRVVLQPVADRNKSYLEGTETPLGGYGQNYGIGYLPAGEESLAMQADDWLETDGEQWRVRRREVFSLRGEALYLWCVLTKEEDDGGTV